MDFDLSEEQRLLKESVDGLLGSSYEFEQRKKYMAEKGVWSKSARNKLAEQGLLGLPFSAMYILRCSNTKEEPNRPPMCSLSSSCSADNTKSLYRISKQE